MGLKMFMSSVVVWFAFNLFRSVEKDEKWKNRWSALCGLSVLAILFSILAWIWE